MVRGGEISWNMHSGIFILLILFLGCFYFIYPKRQSICHRRVLAVESSGQLQLLTSADANDAGAP